MNGHLQLLREDLRQARDTAGEERVALMLSQLERVAKIVRGGLTRGSWPAPRQVSTDLHLLAARMVRFLEPSLDEAGVTAVVQPAEAKTCAATDPDLVEQILLNLLKNAIEALPRGGRITLSAGRDGAIVYLDVADDGPGLPAEARNQLFQPFVTSKGAAGTGLGLAVSRRLARALGGELAYVESEKGTRWRLTLPIPEGP
jgi:signal transduction histidine kinase